VFNNIPLETAIQMNEETRAAFSIVFSGFHGSKFNWDSFTFEEQK